MAKCHKKHHKRFDSINVIPFIDIMLVLLVMVLTTATFIKQGIIPVDLPKAESAQKQESEKKELTIYVKKDGQIYIEKEQVTPKTLEEKLSKMPKDQTIILRSDKESRFQDFVTVMNTLKKLKLEQLYIVTKE